MIVITGTGGTSEFEVAQKIASELTKLWPGLEASPAEDELVRVAAGAKISGYKVSDLDVLIAGKLRQGRAFVPRRVVRTHDGHRVPGAVRVSGFVAVIEVKDHDPSRCRITGDSIEVRYSGDGPARWSNATEQNIDQLHAVKAYLDDQHASVFINRAVVMRGFDKSPCAGALGGAFDGAMLMTAICETSPVLNARGAAVLRAGPTEVMDRVLAAPVFRRLTATTLDRRRMDRIITRNPAIEIYLEQLGSRMLRFRGRGGTGKTVMLLQLAWRAFEERASRSLVLTYNQALASDIRRLLALMNVPSDPAEGGVALRTVMSFVAAWLGKLGLTVDDGGWSAGFYQQQCSAALDMLRAGAITTADIEAVKLEDPTQFAFDYLIADEAQDWPGSEVELLKVLYGPKRICLADGVDQLIRGGAPNWERGVSENSLTTIPLKKCLRMKANLAVFANTLAERADVQWRVEPNREAGGGRVVLVTGPLARRQELVSDLLEEAAAAGNQNVDCLFCVPPNAVVESIHGGRESVMAGVLQEWGHEVWDGANELQRRDFPRSSSCLRVVQYASCRGLEGWTVFLDALDQFWLAARGDALRDAQRGDAFATPTAAVAAWRQCLIPLSRGIDTIVIGLSDPSSEASKILLSVARQLPDLAEIINAGD